MNRSRCENYLLADKMTRQNIGHPLLFLDITDHEVTTTYCSTAPVD